MAKDSREKTKRIEKISIDDLVAMVAAQIGEPPESVRGFVNEKRSEEAAALARLFGHAKKPE